MRQTDTLRTWPLIIVVALTLLAGCAQLPPNQPPAGTLRWSLEGVSDIVRLDPARLGSSQENIPVYLIFGGLVRINDRLEIVGEGAERWTISADGMLYTFNLRRNLKYGDGSQATAQHFADALARSIAPDTGTDFAMTFLEHVIGARDVRDGKAASLAGVRALDDYTLAITLDSPRGYFLSQLTYGLTYLAPPGKIEAEGEAWLDKAFGTGPFRVKSRDPGKGLLLEGNPYYWAGSPGVQGVQFYFYPTTDAAFSAYLAGEVDVMGSVQSGVPAGRLGETKGKPGYQTISAPVMRYIGFNNTLPPFNNVYVRQAFAQSIDKDELAQSLGGTVAPAERILPSGFPGTDLPIKPLGFDPVGARAALGLAGFVSGNDLPPVALTYDRGDPDLEHVAEVLQQGWRETLGIDVRLEPVAIETLISRLNTMVESPSDPATAMQMYLSIWSADYPDPQNFISLQLHSRSPYNNGHWASEAFDRLVEGADQLSGVGGRGERFKLYRDAEQIAVSEVGWLPLYSPQATLVIRPTVQGLVPTVTPQGIIATDWTRVRIVEEGRQ
ncbi:MAG: peptide ABC transporter substrate-binding protein [Chloroflexales bacterium]|nr:peptide ABC transporter substrate-binding protein [Chloroflexales bacterium]